MTEQQNTTQSPNEKRAKQVISAGIIVFRRTREGVKFLILYHGRNYWNFPKGRLEKAERSYQAALREVEEETGLKPAELKNVGNFKAFERFSYNRGKERIFKVVILYLAETRQPNITVSDEHEGYGWFSFSEAKRILGRYQDSIKILQRANQFIMRGRRQRPSRDTGITANAVKPSETTVKKV